MIGGFIGGGIGNPLFSSGTFALTGSGGLVAGGAAPVKNKIKVVAAGGLIFDGTVALNFGFERTGVGGVTFGGQAWVARVEKSDVWE